MFPKTFLVSLVLASCGLGAWATPTARQNIAIPVKIVNNCDFDTPVWHGNTLIGTVQSNGILDTTSDTTGFFYQGVGSDGVSQPDFSETVRIGITGYDYYYAVKAGGDYTVGVTVAPTGQTEDAQGFCATAGCDAATCKADSNNNLAYSHPPTRFPNPTGAPPTRPLFQCPGASNGEGYTITFCP